MKHGYRPKGKWNPTYKSWQLMRSRCHNQRDIRYTNYGGRGIRVCQRWDSFENFLADMGERPLGMTLDRINRNGDYEPSNCRWATALEQQNNRSTNRRIAFGGTELTLTQWARAIGIGATTIKQRIERGWSVDRALTEKVNR